MASVGTAVRRPGVLIASNFANDTGYAWTYIHGIQSVVAREFANRGVGIFLSFATIRGAVTTIAPDIPFQSFEFDPISVGPAGAVALLRRVRRHRIRFAYLTDMPTWHWLYAVLRIAGVRRIVVHSHVSVADPRPSTPERGLRRLLKRFIHRTPLRADAVYAVSSFVAHRLAEKACFPEPRTFLIRYGIDVARYECPETSRRTGLLRVFIGARATRFKGVHTLIEATRLLSLREGIPAFEVRYAGDGPDLEKLREQVRTAGIEGVFHFLGALPNTLDELCAADVVIIPSIWGDASPLAAIEALAAGKPVVASSAGGLPEIVGGPDSGLLVPPGDAVALADAIESLLRDPARRETTGANARRRARTIYTPEAFARTMVERVVEDFGLISASRERDLS